MRKSEKKKVSESPAKQIEEEEDRKMKVKPLDQNSNNIELGVFGVNNIKKREKTVIDSRPPPINAPRNNNVNSNSNPTAFSAPKDQSSSVDNLLDFNLKGVNLKLNEKLPFAMAPKEKKKR